MGKVGKPPKPPAVVFNNRLLLQLSALKEEKGRTWAEIQQLFVRLFPDEDFPPAVPLIRSAVQQFSRTKDNQHFLQYDRDIYYVGSFTKEAGVTQSALTRDNLRTCVSLTNGLMSELAHFAAKQGFKSDVLFKWIFQLSGGAFLSMSSASMDTTVSKTKLQTQALRRRQSKTGGQDALNSFLRAPFSSTFGPSSSGQSPASQPSGLQPASQPSGLQPASLQAYNQPASLQAHNQPASLQAHNQLASLLASRHYLVSLSCHLIFLGYQLN